MGGDGIVARFNSIADRPKKRILFRAELDAVAVQEETGLPHQSKKEEAMHACGHDGHMAILTGLAQKLKQKRPDNVEIYLLFQPSEETGEGAARVLEDSRFQALDIDHGFALHNLPGFPENIIVNKEEAFAAGSVGIEISVKGSYSHAAYPEKGLNPASTVARLIQNIDSAMENFLSETEDNKLACTYIKMGERAFGISPGNAMIGYTIRSASDDALERGIELMEQAIGRIADTFGGEINSQQVEPFRTTINSKEGARIVQKICKEKGFSYKQLEQPFPWSEDFGEFRRQFPITIFGLGAGEEKPPLHSEKYDFNENLIPVGIELFAGIIEYYESLSDK